MRDLPETATLLLDRDDGWLTVWLNRPDARNALSAEMAGELAAVVEAVRDDRTVRGVTFRGKGDVFCAGGDIKGFRSIVEGDAIHDEVAAFSRDAGRLFHAVNELPQVTIMLVHGAAMAGGLGLACAGDIVVVARDTRFALTETLIGIPPAQIAPLVVGHIRMAGVAPDHVGHHVHRLRQMLGRVMLGQRGRAGERLPTRADVGAAFAGEMLGDCPECHRFLSLVRRARCGWPVSFARVVGAVRASPAECRGRTGRDPVPP